MIMKRILLGLTTLVLALGVWGCEEYGKVDQGRTIGFDKDKHTVTIVQDKAMDARNPDYSIMPPHTYTMPVDPAERGADPKAGYRLKLDIEGKIVRIYNPESKELEDLSITIIDAQKNIDSLHPLVFDKDSNKEKTFPVVDKDKKTITIYSPRQKILATFTVPDEYFTLPDRTWEAGDEVRIYYKEEGKALRFMNITKTDIFKK